MSDPYKSLLRQCLYYVSPDCMYALDQPCAHRVRVRYHRNAPPVCTFMNSDQIYVMIEQGRHSKKCRLPVDLIRHFQTYATMVGNTRARFPASTRKLSMSPNSTSDASTPSPRWTHSRTATPCPNPP